MPLSVKRAQQEVLAGDIKHSCGSQNQSLGTPAVAIRLGFWIFSLVVIGIAEFSQRHEWTGRHLAQ